jgi:chemotaxis protein methyltransferase CheR
VTSRLSREAANFLARPTTAPSTLKPETLQAIAERVREACSMTLRADGAHFIASRLEPVAARFRYASIDALAAALQTDASKETLEAVVEALLVDETSFFRDGAPFETFRNRVLPALVARRPALRRLRVWSAACATGQEAYALAACVRAAPPVVANCDVEIVATDVSKRSLRRAKEGLYSEFEANRGVPPAMRTTMFDVVDGGYSVKHVVRSSIKFRRLNLAGPWPSGPPYDVILLRNVLIYFDLDVRRDILRRVRGALADDGFLLLGAGETLLGVDDGFVSAEPEFPWFLKRRR